MDAPTYPPAAVYQQPTAAPFEFGVDTVSLKELLSAAATRDLLFKELPGLKFMVKVEALQSNLSAFTVRTLMLGGAHMGTPEQLARIDEQLRALPVSERPVL